MMLKIWNKIGVVGSICSILAFACWFLIRDGGTSVNVSVDQSPEAKVQTVVDSPGATQIIADQVTINVSPKLERKLTMEPVHVNKPVGNRFESLFHGKLEAQYPIPNLHVEAHGETVEEVSLSPRRTGIHISGHTGKRNGYAFTSLQNAIGNLVLKVITSKPEKLDIRFTVEE